jgi:hypothetical protein
MQNSLERLLDGMATTLADEMAPALSDPYLRAQAVTAAELLRTLAPRLVWDLDAALPWAPALRTLAAEAVESVGTHELPACAALSGAVAPGLDASEHFQTAHLAALAELAAHDRLPDAINERVSALVDQDAETERALLKRARR